MGEGEVPLLELTQHIQGRLARKNVSSLWYRDSIKAAFNGRVFYNIEDQSCPDFDGLSLGLYASYTQNGIKNVVIPYSTARGCSGRCGFCTYPKDDGPWQAKSAKKIVNDVTVLKKKYKSIFLDFRDSNFNVSYKHVNELSDKLIKEKVGIRWNALVKGNNLDNDLLVKMKKSGCHKLAWGIESGSNRLLRLMKKDIDIRKCTKLLKIAKKAGISNLIYLMVGYPYESSRDLEETALLLKDNARFIDNFIISHFRVNYGSFVYDNKDALNIEIQQMRASPFSYGYTYRYKKAEECGKRDVARRNMKSRNRVMGYGFRYIKYKHIRFPLNVAVKYLGLIFPKGILAIEQLTKPRILD